MTGTRMARHPPDTLRSLDKVATQLDTCRDDAGECAVFGGVYDCVYDGRVWEFVTDSMVVVHCGLVWWRLDRDGWDGWMDGWMDG